MPGWCWLICGSLTFLVLWIWAAGARLSKNVCEADKKIASLEESLACKEEELSQQLVLNQALREELHAQERLVDSYEQAPTPEQTTKVMAELSEWTNDDS